MAHLGSHLAGNEANIGEHLAAVNAVLETRRNGVDINNRLQYIIYIYIYIIYIIIIYIYIYIK